MIPRLRPRLGVRELLAALRPRGADDIERFEQAFAQQSGQGHAVAFPYGRTALMILLEALDLKGKEVICPAYTCIVVPHAIVYAGAEPVFVDSTDRDFNLDFDLLDSAVTGRTGAIIATSIFGYPVELDRLNAFQARYPDVRIIQDCAHSFHARSNGVAVNTVGDAAIYGLNVSKLMTSIFGGMVTTDDPELARRVRELRDQRLRPASLGKSFRRLLYLLAVYPAFWPPFFGLVDLLLHLGLLDTFVQYYDEAIIDMPGDYLEQMTPIEARVGVAQLDRLEAIVADRRAAARFYDAELRDVPGLRLPPLVEGATYSHYVCLTGRRDALVEYCRRHGLELGSLIEYCCPEMAAYSARPGSQGDYSVSSEWASQAINLPVWTSNPRTLGRVVDVVRAGLKAVGG